jgi:hypothetical protein
VFRGGAKTWLVSCTGARLADNKSGELKEWDLAALTAEVSSLGESVDLSLFGFDAAALDAMLNPSDMQIAQATTRSTAQLTMKFGKYSVPLDAAEFGHLVRLLAEHEAAVGTRFGFVASIVEKLSNVAV